MDLLRLIFCDVCSQRWCELCLQRVTLQEPHLGTTNCKADLCQHFCEKYLSANDNVKEKCEKRFPWIKIYAISRMNDDDAIDWINENGQICPCCTGIERISGCNHMTCTNCDTDFCYDCGDYYDVDDYPHICIRRQTYDE